MLRRVQLAASDFPRALRFWRACLGAGGKDHGKPGSRPDYSATYWAAFVIDPDDNNIEAVVA